MPCSSTRLALALAWLGAGVLLASPASAVWNGPRDIVHGTANTLEQGELIIGVVTPAIYGATDSITLVVHPLNWLLLSPNAGLRIRLIDADRMRMSLQLEAAGTIRGDEEETAAQDPRSLWHIRGGPVVTFDVGGGVMLTAGAGYEAEFEPDDHAITFHGGVGWLISRSNLLLLQGGAHYSLPNEKFESEQVSLLYAYAWERARLGVGVAYGRFPILRVDQSPLEVPIWPVIDFWGRF